VKPCVDCVLQCTVITELEGSILADCACYNLPPKPLSKKKKI